VDISARRRRFTVLRVTAFPTCLPTTNAMREGSPEDRAPKRPWARTVRDPARRPRLMVVRMSSLVRRRWAALSTARPARLRPTDARGPCDDDRPGSRGRHAYASAGGSHACASGGGCSAGRCASSRECSPSCVGPQSITVIGYWTVTGSTATARRRTRAFAPVRRHAAGVENARPLNGTWSLHGGSNRPYTRDASHVQSTRREPQVACPPEACGQSVAADLSCC